MSDKSRSCPKCQAAMDFRLGEFDCPNCGHSESAAQPKAERKGSGPGFRSEQQWGGGQAIPPSAPPPPTTGTVYSPEVSHSFGSEETALPKYHSSLQTEKHVYLALAVLGSLSSAFGSTSGLGLGGGAMAFGGSIFSSLIGLFVLAFVLYGSELWAKNCCMYWTAFQAVLTILGSFFLHSFITQSGSTLGQGSGLHAGLVIFFGVLIGLASMAWLIWILYRDSKYLS